jgi:L-alanine-DL-glutamate epimerase-like enolase superfamily enzyme
MAPARVTVVVAKLGGQVREAITGVAQGISWKNQERKANKRIARRGTKHMKYLQGKQGGMTDIETNAASEVFALCS